MKILRASIGTLASIAWKMNLVMMSGTRANKSSGMRSGRHFSGLRKLLGSSNESWRALRALSRSSSSPKERNEQRSVSAVYLNRYIIRFATLIFCLNDPLPRLWRLAVGHVPQAGSDVAEGATQWELYILHL